MEILQKGFPQYLKIRKLKDLKSIPRLPLEGSLDLTYRCNNNCRHCWLRIPANSPEEQEEPSTRSGESWTRPGRWAVANGLSLGVSPCSAPISQRSLIT